MTKKDGQVSIWLLRASDMNTSVSLGFLEGYGVVITIPTLDDRELIFSATGKKLEDFSMTHVSRSKEAQG